MEHRTPAEEPRSAKKPDPMVVLANRAINAEKALKSEQDYIKNLKKDLAASRDGVKAAREEADAAATNAGVVRAITRLYEIEVERLNAENRRLTRYKDEASAKIVAARDALLELQLTLEDMLQNRSDCEECEGTGGRPVMKDVIAANRMEISHSEVDYWTDPEVEPCEECMGCKKDIPRDFPTLERIRGAAK